MSTTIFYKVRGSTEWTKVELEAYGIDGHALAKQMVRSLPGWEDCFRPGLFKVSETPMKFIAIFARDSDTDDRRSERMLVVYPKNDEEVTAKDCDHGEALLKFLLGRSDATPS